MREWIERLTAPGALVCDPMVGSGSFVLAAHQLVRRVVGAEIDAAAYSTAVNRLQTG